MNAALISWGHVIIGVAAIAGATVLGVLHDVTGATALGYVAAIAGVTLGIGAATNSVPASSVTTTLK